LSSKTVPEGMQVIAGGLNASDQTVELFGLRGGEIVKLNVKLDRKAKANTLETYSTPVEQVDLILQTVAAALKMGADPLWLIINGPQPATAPTTASVRSSNRSPSTALATNSGTYICSDGSNGTSCGAYHYCCAPLVCKDAAKKECGTSAPSPTPSPTSTSSPAGPNSTPSPTPTQVPTLTPTQVPTSTPTHVPTATPTVPRPYLCPDGSAGIPCGTNNYCCAPLACKDAARKLCGPGTPPVNPPKETPRPPNNPGNRCPPSGSPGLTKKCNGSNRYWPICCNPDDICVENIGTGAPYCVRPVYPKPGNGCPEDRSNMDPKDESFCCTCSVDQVCIWQSYSWRGNKFGLYECREKTENWRHCPAPPQLCRQIQ
jgi:hypothetical protein